MDKERLQQITAPLLTWFAEYARDLPWRIRPTAYRVWVSEIMLQQTRVEAVKPFYARFMEALPDVTDLAACPEDRLLKLWEGLGYYSRVRNMQKAARMICEQYDGVMPADYEIAAPGDWQLYRRCDCFYRRRKAGGGRQCPARRNPHR
ncbi:MAG: hypothetical protein ACLTLE_00900 [Lachnospiraceae bacterium]